MGGRSMRAARFYGPGQPLRIEQTPVPRPAPGEALIRVRASGMCHTELHMLDGVLNLGVVPLTPGHEVVGEVIEVRCSPRALGDEQSTLRFGQRVVLYYYAPCGQCRYCASGSENLCPNVARQVGFTADGGYAEYLVAPVRSFVSLSDSLSDEEAVGLACGGATAFHAARAIARVQAGETAVIYGVGGVGFYLVQICKLAGAKVIAIGRTPEKLELAAVLGADVCVNANASDPLAAVYDLTGGDGADVVFDLVASAATMAIAPRMLARQGRLIFAGYSGEPFQVPPLWLVLRELQVLGSVGHTLSGLRETVRLAEVGQLRGVAGPTFALDQINEALAALRAGTLIGRAVIKPTNVQSDAASTGHTTGRVPRDHNSAADSGQTVPGGRQRGREAESRTADPPSMGRETELRSRRTLASMASGPPVPADRVQMAVEALWLYRPVGIKQADASPPPQAQAHGIGPHDNDDPRSTTGDEYPRTAVPAAWVRIADTRKREPALQRPNGEENSPRSPTPIATERRWTFIQSSPTPPGPQIPEAGTLMGDRHAIQHPKQPQDDHPFEALLLEMIGRGVDAPTDDQTFNKLALGIFAYQYERNVPYRAFCDYRGVTPHGVKHWRELPAVPIGAFKETTLVTEPPDQAAALFLSSGTTSSEQRSRHYHPTLTVYDASTTTNFKSYVLPDASTMDCFVLNPPPEALPNSSLAYYLGLMSRQFGDAASGYFVNDTGLRYDALVDALRDARERRRPVALLGTTFAFVHLLDRMADDGSRLHLSEGSRVFDTGGVKGRSRDIERNELATALVVRLGVPMDFQVNMYGLTELSTQFIDSSLRDHVRGRPGSRYKSIPPWSRTRVLDPETLEPIARGMPGVLCHTDLANRASVCTILTEDLGLETGDGFEIVGRVKGSQARGCSIAMDELLIATGRRA